MDTILLQEELMRRYLYLYENKELILALCINYGIEKEHYKTEIKKITELLHSVEKKKRFEDNPELKDSTIKLLSSLLDDLNECLHVQKPYLFANVSDEIVNAYEEFLFTDENIEETTLYKHIEALKNNPLFLESVQDMINDLEEKRKNNEHLKRNPTFTVWRILSYVRNRNKNNAAVLDALEKYYNIDRYILTGTNWESGYKLLQNDCESQEKTSSFPNFQLIAESNIWGEYSAVIFNYPGNEFEKEDNYYAFAWSIEFDDKPLYNDPKTNFMANLIRMPMLSEELKSDLYQKVKSKPEKKTLEL